MRTIRISEDVWNVIAAHGKFGETENDVLERLLNVPKDMNNQMKHQIVVTNPVVLHKKPNDVKHPFANIKMTAEVRGKHLFVSFESGAENKWLLPDFSDKQGIRKVRDLAVSFATQNGASFGQEQAVKKALTNAGYWLVK